MIKGVRAHTPSTEQHGSLTGFRDATLQWYRDSRTPHQQKQQEPGHLADDSHHGFQEGIAHQSKSHTAQCLVYLVLK